MIRQLNGKSKGAVVKRGTLVDATVIASASIKMDEEARWAGHRRRKPAHGYKAHAAADSETGIVRAVAVTTANVHDGNMLSAVLPEEPGEVYADMAYDSGKADEAIRAVGGRPQIVRRATWGGPEALARLEARNRAVSRIRCRIEKIFGTWKRSYGLRRARFIGLARVALQVRLTAMAFNLKRAAALLRGAAA